MIRVERGHGSRGSGANDVDLPYRRIGALSPDFFVQFKYPVYAGQQVLFRDPECTSPVTEAGNHTIGGVLDPFTGAIVLTQPSASRRPLWGGESVGAVFDGIDDYLDPENQAFYLGQEMYLSAVLNQDPGSLANGHAVDVHHGNTPRLVIRPGTNYRDIYFRTYLTESLGIAGPSYPIVDGVDTVVGGYRTPVGVGARMNGIETNYKSWTAADLGPDFEIVLGCGSVRNANRFTGTISAVALFARGLSAGEMNAVDASMGGNP